MHSLQIIIKEYRIVETVSFAGKANFEFEFRRLQISKNMELVK